MGFSPSTTTLLSHCTTKTNFKVLNNNLVALIVWTKQGWTAGYYNICPAHSKLGGEVLGFRKNRPKWAIYKHVILNTAKMWGNTILIGTVSWKIYQFSEVGLKDMAHILEIQNILLVLREVKSFSITSLSTLHPELLCFVMRDVPERLVYLF